MSFILLGILNAQAEAAAAGDYDLLETTILGSSASSVSFTSLNSTYGSDYKHLQLRMVLSSDRANDLDETLVTINGDSGSKYASHILEGTGTNVDSRAESSQTNMKLRFTTGSDTTNSFGAIILDILDPFDTGKNTTLRSLGGLSGNTRKLLALGSGLYNDTAALNSLEFSPRDGTNWIAASRISLYGIKAA